MSKLTGPTSQRYPHNHRHKHTHARVRGGRACLLLFCVPALGHTKPTHALARVFWGAAGLGAAGRWQALEDVLVTGR